MTSRERVLKTFALEKPDRMPVDYLGNEGINSKLIKHFKVKSYDEMLDALDTDFRGICAPYTGKNLFPKKAGLNVDRVYGFYTKWIPHPAGGYWDFVDFPLKDADEETIANFPMPDPGDFDYSGIPAMVKKFAGRAVYAGSAGFADVINSTGRVMGMEQTLLNLITEDEATLTYINRRTEMELGWLDKTIKAAKGAVDFIWIGEDLGTQIAPMISIDLYRKVLKPLHKKYVDLAKSYNLPVMVHTCGSSSWVYEDFIEMGVKAVDTLQPEAAGMNPEYLIKHFGGRLAFHGSISTAGPLAYGTPAEVDADVKAKCGIYRPTNGYMISPTHMIQDNSPLENVLTLYNAARKYGGY